MNEVGDALDALMWAAILAALAAVDVVLVRGAGDEDDEMNVTVIMPTDKDRYEVGWNYLKRIGNHVLWLRCVDFVEGYGFVFEELLDVPVSWTWLEHLT